MGKDNYKKILLYCRNHWQFKVFLKKLITRQ